MSYARSILGGGALLLTLSRAGHPQANPPRVYVDVTLATAKWDNEGPPAVIVLAGPDEATIVLRAGATPDDLFSAIAILEAKRLQLAPAQENSKQIVVKQTSVAPIPQGVRARLSARLQELEAGEERDIPGFGRAKAITIRLSLKARGSS